MLREGVILTLILANYRRIQVIIIIFNVLSMIHVASFTFNPFQENTYLIYDDTLDCVIIDPGCYTVEEKRRLSTFISDTGLKPVLLLNTHCHLDHIFGNLFVHKQYGLPLHIPKGEQAVLESYETTCLLYGIPIPDPQPEQVILLNDEDTIDFGNSILRVISTPGHSPDSYSFYSEEQEFIISGDVLFLEGVGRVDLPGGDWSILVESIKEKLFKLPQGTRVYPGHGPATTIGHEVQNNPFLQG